MKSSTTHSLPERTLQPADFSGRDLTERPGVQKIVESRYSSPIIQERRGGHGEWRRLRLALVYLGGQPLGEKQKRRVISKSLKGRILTNAAGSLSGKFDERPMPASTSSFITNVLRKKRYWESNLGGDKKKSTSFG